MGNKKRIALITTWFPPKNGVAVNRMHAFAEYLSEDFEVEVFTVGNSKEKSDKYKLHYFTAAKWGEWIKHNPKDSKPIHHFKSLCNIIVSKFNFSIYNAWNKKVVDTVIYRQNKKPFDVIISSFNPIECHYVAEKIKSLYPEIIWHADFRDGFSNNPNIDKKTSLKYSKFEDLINNKVDLISSVSLPLVDEFKKNVPGCKFYLEVRNGFNHIVKVNKIPNENFTINFSGTLYGRNKPDTFFVVLSKLIENGDIENSIKVNFVGSSSNFSIPSSLKSNVFIVPRVPQLKAVEFMAKADANLLILAPVPQKGIYSGKLFDYLSVEKPIIALIDTTDVAADLIREHNAGFVADFHNEKEIEQAILGAYQLWVNKESLDIDRNKTLSLHRKIQVQKLSNELNKILGE